MTKTQETASTTVTGKTCQRWDTQTPNAHSDPAWAHNYCRNPVDNSSKWGVWCWVTDPGAKRSYDWCYIPGIKYFSSYIT